MDSIQVVSIAASFAAIVSNTGQTQATYRSAEYGYSVSIPDGWVPIPRDVLHELTDTVLSEQAKQEFYYDTGFQHDDTYDWFEYPYILIQVVPTPIQFSPKEAEKDLIHATTFDANDLKKRVKPGVGETLSDFGLSLSAFDKDGMTFQLNGKQKWDGQEIYLTSHGHFGRMNLIQINFYSTADVTDDHSEALAEVVQTFRFDSGHEYDHSLPTSAGFDAGPWSIGIIVLAIWFANRIRLARRSKQSNPIT